jgi:hypothetical protein
MKKLYLSLVVLMLSVVVFGQRPAAELRNFPGTKPAPTHKSTAAPQYNHAAQTIKFDGWFDPIADQAFNRDLKFKDVGTVLKDIRYYTQPLFPDSTVVISNSSGNSAVFMHAVGSILDPKSSFLYTSPGNKPSGGSEGPVVTNSDPYYIDSVAIDAWYVKKKVSVQDTLYVWVSWQQNAENDVFSKNKTSDIWPAPTSDWRDSILSIQIDTLRAPQGTGNVVHPRALPGNVSLVKYLLTNNDTAVGGNLQQIIVRLVPVGSAGLLIPAGAVVACYYAYVPQAGSYLPGDCVFEYDGAKSPQVSNGFAFRLWAETEKNKTRHNYLVDPTSKAEGALVLDSYDRYPSKNNPVVTFITGYFQYGPAINFHIHGNSSVGINEISANGNFSLGQNVPNPFTNETTISYRLKANVKSASLVIYNVAGVKVYEQAQSNLSAGEYTTNVEASKLSSGVYFYSLIVDGSQLTKKMVITE